MSAYGGCHALEFRFSARARVRARCGPGLADISHHYTRAGPLIERFLFLFYHWFICGEIYDINRNIIGLYYTGLLNAVERSVHLHG